MKATKLSVKHCLQETNQTFISITAPKVQPKSQKVKKIFKKNYWTIYVNQAIGLTCTLPLKSLGSVRFFKINKYFYSERTH